MNRISKIRFVVCFAMLFNAVTFYLFKFKPTLFTNLQEDYHLRTREAQRDSVYGTDDAYSDMLGLAHTSSIVRMINCSNIHEITLKGQLGSGWNKQSFRGNFHGIPVCVKTVNVTGKSVQECINEALLDTVSGRRNPEYIRKLCLYHSAMTFMKEILLYEELRHPIIAPLLGYCVRNTKYLQKDALVSVIQLGQEIRNGKDMIIPEPVTWQRRIMFSLELTDFLIFLEHSPMGSLRITDVKLEHFMLINGKYKYIDLDNLVLVERLCQLGETVCDYGLKCENGKCKRFNEVRNLEMMRIVMFRRLLEPSEFPIEIGKHLEVLLNDIETFKITAALLLKSKLELLLDTFDGP